MYGTKEKINIHGSDKMKNRIIFAEDPEKIEQIKIMSIKKKTTVTALMQEAVDEYLLKNQ